MSKTQYRYSDDNTHTDNLTLEEAKEFQRTQNGGKITKMPPSRLSQGHTPGPLAMTLDGTGIMEQDDGNFRIATFVSLLDARLYGPLFIAAPDLLAALKEIAAKLGEHEGKGDKRAGELIIDAFYKAKAAITKAEGRAQ